MSTQSKPRKKQEQQQQRKPTDEEARAAIKRLEEKDPGLKQLLKIAYGYAVFPNVGKASLVVGGSYGRGPVYEQGELIGHATIGQTTAGVQLGGSTFAEIIAFRDKQALDRFTHNRLRFAANASTSFVKAGAMATKDLEKGTKVLVYSKGGMLVEVAIGGQKFNFKPTGDSEQGQSGGTGSAAHGDDEDGDQQQDGSNGGGLAGRGLRLAAAAAAAAVAQIKPEDVTFAIEALHTALQKFAQQEEGPSHRPDDGDEEDVSAADESDWDESDADEEDGASRGERSEAGDDDQDWAADAEDDEEAMQGDEGEEAHLDEQEEDDSSQQHAEAEQGGEEKSRRDQRHSSKKQSRSNSRSKQGRQSQRTARH